MIYATFELSWDELEAIQRIVTKKARNGSLTLTEDTVRRVCEEYKTEEKNGEKV